MTNTKLKKLFQQGYASFWRFAHFPKKVVTDFEGEMYLIFTSSASTSPRYSYNSPFSKVRDASNEDVDLLKIMQLNSKAEQTKSQLYA